MWSYRARLDRVVDGDTVDMDIDLGFRHVITGHRLRLAGLNTPEVRGEEREAGLAAKAFVIDWCREIEAHYDIHGTDLWPFTVDTEKSGKYGRWLAWIYPARLPGSEFSLNQALLDAGLAERIEY